VVVVDLQVAGRLNGQVEEPVLGEGRQHVVKKPIPVDTFEVPFPSRLSSTETLVSFV
jgi:hypothetical protein